MKKIYLVRYDNGEEYPEDLQQFVFKYCYPTREQAKQAISELKQDKDFLESVCFDEHNTDSVEFWIESVDLVG